jgi:RNA polymerase sigma-70 factor (ECF subfamily)
LAEAYDIDRREVAAPERRALLELYMDRRANLVRFFAAKTRSLSEAEDLVQDIYMRLLTLDLRGGEVRNPSAFLFRIGANLLQDRLRGERRARARDGAWLYSASISIAGEGVVDEPAPDEVVASRERFRRLAAAVEEMPPQMRRAFRLHKIDGLTHAETARAMDISTSATEKHISAALRFLLKRFS